jgi:hypothetical protein
MVSISAFEAEGVGSNPAPTTYVGFSLTGKTSCCEREEKGSSPKSTKQGIDDIHCK